MATTKKAAAKKAKTTKAVPKSMPKAGKDPKGGLTEVGREFFAETQGSHLKPGVQGKADTPEKMQRKGSFLRRHYANPRGPVVDDQGRPTRQALQAAAWGEPVPKSEGDEKQLAAKGKQLLEKYHEVQEGGAAAKMASGKKSPGGTAKKAPVKKAASKAPAKKGPAQKKSPAARQQAAKAIAKRSR